MSKKLIAILVGLLALARPSRAQTNPCDSLPTSGTLTSKTGIVGFCHSQLDANGSPDVLTSAIVRINGTVVLTWTNPSGGITPTIATPSPVKGLYYFETTPIPLSKGNGQAVTVSVTDADSEGPQSDPFSLSVKGPGPAKVGGAKVR